MKTVIDGEQSDETCDKHLESAKMRGVSGPILAWQEENDEKPLPTPIENSSQILTIHQMKIKDGVIYYKIKCKGRFKPLSNAKAIITPQFQVDPIKLQELLF